MEGGSLFNPGFLGSSFLWWIGQIADDATWRDNILPGKHKDTQKPDGWGRRYKVRIIGLHDQGEESIDSDQLPWAQIMYPVTGGGGQTSASHTSNLRQGMMVFGFFLDGQDQQIPVIMGVLGHNVQVPLSAKIGDNRVSNNTPGPLATSGVAEGRNPPPNIPAEGGPNPVVPDDDLRVTKPKSVEKQKEDVSADKIKEAAQKDGGLSADNNYGLDPSKSLTKEQFADMRSAVAEAEALGYEKGSPEYEDLKMKRVAQGIRNRNKKDNSPIAPVEPGPTLEGVDDVTVISAGDTKRHSMYQEKGIILSNCSFTTSNSKAIQTALDNLVKKVEAYINTFQSYIDRVSSVINDIRKVLNDVACEIARYMKPLMDKVMEFVLKKLNEALTNVVAAMPSSMRHQFADMKKILNELILCLYNKITGKLCELLKGILDKALGLGDLENKAKRAAESANGDDSLYRRLAPKVPACYAENITAQVFKSAQPEIEEANNSIIENMDNFLDDMQKQLAGVSGVLDGIMNKIPDISGSLTAAFGFENIKLNIFGCELEPNCPIDDYYTLQGGGAGQPDAKLPSPAAVDQAVADDGTEIPAGQEDVGYIQPTSGQQDVAPSGSDSQPAQPAPAPPPPPKTYPQQSVGSKTPDGATVSSEVKTSPSGRKYQLVTSDLGDGAPQRRYID